MYAAFDETKMIVGVHDDRDVVEEFVLYHYKRWQKVYTIRKIPKGAWKEIEDRYSGRYLVSYGNTYVPSDDVEYLGYYNDPDLEYQYKTTLDLLFKILEFDKLSPKKRKAIERTIEYISEIQRDKNVVSQDDIEYAKRNHGNIQSCI